MNRGSVYIIPREDEIMDDVFYKGITKDHLEAFQEFSDKYKLDYKFRNEDYNIAPCVLANDGNLVIKTEDTTGMIICYIPRVVTDRQNLWFHTMQDDFLHYQYIGAYKIDNNDYDNMKNVEGFPNILKEIDKRNILYTKEGNDIYVGKKI